MSPNGNHLYRFGAFTLDTDQRVVLRESKPLPLAPKVFETLLALVEDAGRIVEKDELMRRIWPDTFVEEANLAFNVQQIRKALGDNARQPIYIETVARRGYRFIAPLEASDDTATESGLTASLADTAADLDAEPLSNAEVPEAGTAAGPGGSKPSWPAAVSSKVLWVVPLIFVLVVVGGWLLRHREPERSEAADGRVMLAVLPFRNLTGDAGQDYFSDGLTEEMITQLGSIDPQHVGVIALTSVMRFKNSTESLDQIGRDLGVDYVLEGSLRRDGDRVLAATRLVRARDQSQLWSREYDREAKGAFTLQRQIAEEVAGQVRSALGETKLSEPSDQLPLSSQAYEARDLYLKGQFYWKKRTTEDFQQAIGFFRQAIEKDPNFAPAYVGLADTYALMGGYSMRPQTDYIQQARAAAQKALDLDASSAEAHTAMALIVQNYDWDWDRAGREFRRAIEINPNYATAHHWYAEHLTWLGRFDEALRESDEALKIDPLSPVIATDRGATLYYARRYDQAIEQLRAVQHVSPSISRAGSLLLASLEQSGEPAQALADIENWRPPPGIDSPVYWAELSYAYGRAQQPEKAKEALAKLLDMNKRQEVDAVALVWACLGAGDKEQAFAWLERAYQQHSNVMVTIKVEPRLDPLRSDPRFQELLHNVGLNQ